MGERCEETDRQTYTRICRETCRVIDRDRETEKETETGVEIEIKI